MGFLEIYKTLAEYREAVEGGMTHPNVSLVEEDFSVHFHPYRNCGICDGGEEDIDTGTTTGETTGTTTGETTGGTEEETNGYFEYSDGTKVPFEFSTITNEYDFENIDKDRVISVSLSDNVKTVGNESFGIFPNLKTIKLNDNINMLGGSAFSGTHLNCVTYKGNNYTSLIELEKEFKQNGVIYSINTFIGTPLMQTKKGVFVDDKDNIITLTPDSFSETIDRFSFDEFFDPSEIVEAYLPENVIFIESFGHFVNLDIIALPNELGYIGEEAFKDTKLRLVIFNNKLYTKSSDLRQTLKEFNVEIGRNAFYGTPFGVGEEFEPEVPETPDEPTDDIQPNNEIWYTSIDGNIVEPSHIYHGEKPLNTYVNGKGVMVFKNDVTDLVGLFFECDTLLSVSLPNGLMSISNDALSNCDNLKTIKIPNSVTEIKYCTFNPGTDIYYDGTRPQWDEITIHSSILSNCTIHCTDGDIRIN